jgi:hypothetical protein
MAGHASDIMSGFLFPKEHRKREEGTATPVPRSSFRAKQTG